MEITEKQINAINKMKSLLKVDGRNPLDEIDLRKMSRKDASILIGGLIDFQKCNKAVWQGYRVSNTAFFNDALDSIYEVIDKYKNNK